MAQSALSTSILVALLVGENHGYAIYKQMVSDVQGNLIVYQWSVYRELPRLLKAGLIEKTSDKAKPVRYRLTPRGRRMLTQEKARVQRLNYLLRERL